MGLSVTSHFLFLCFTPIPGRYGSLEDNKKVQMTAAEAALKKGGRGEPGSY